jgi:hypothetical protein
VIVSRVFSVGLNASACVVAGIDKPSLSIAVLSNAISPLNDDQAKDYNKEDSRFMIRRKKKRKA